MADKKNREPASEPDIEAILEAIAPGGALEKAAKKQSEALTETGAIFKRIENDMNGNRGAVAQIRKMDKMSPDKLADYLRTFEPLLIERGYTLDAIDGNDLVSRAQDGDQDTDEDGDDDADNAEEAETNPLTAAAASMTAGKGKLSIVTPSESKH